MWKDKLIDVATNCAANIVGRLSGAVTRQIDDFHGYVYRIWCGALQFEFALHVILDHYVKETFYVPLTALIYYLLRKINPITSMGSKCPTA